MAKKRKTKDPVDVKSVFVNTIMTERMYNFVYAKAAKLNITKSEYIRSLIEKEMPDTAEDHYDSFMETLSLL